MDAGQAELYRKCARKLERVLSERDQDLRILVGHSNMLQSLTPTFILQHGDDNTNDDNEWESLTVSYRECAAGSECSACSEHVEDLYPVLCGVSITERELPFYEVETEPVQNCVIEKSHIVTRAAPSKIPGSLCQYSVTV